MPTGTGQALQLGVQPTFVVANLAAGGLLYKCTHLDTGNGAMLHQACADAVALSPDAGVFVMRGTYNRDAAGGPTTPTAIPGGGLRGEGEGIVIIQSTDTGDQGVFTNAAGGDLSDLTVQIREPTAAGSGSTIAVDMSSEVEPTIARVTLTFLGTLDAGEAANLVLRTGLQCAGHVSAVTVTGAGWKLRQFIAADFTGVTFGSGTQETFVDALYVTGFDYCATVANKACLVGSSFLDPYSCGILIAGNATSVIGCRIRLLGGTVSADAIVVADGDYTQIANCHIDNTTTGAGTHRGIVVRNLWGVQIHHVVFGGLNSGTIDTGVVIESTASEVQLSDFVVTTGTNITTVVSDAGVNTQGRCVGMTWRGTFIAGAGATTAYAGMAEANAEMLAANAQKRFPATPGVAFRLRVQVISNSMPANTVFTVMLDTGATALTVTVGAAATGQFVDTDSVVFVAAAANSFTTWDLRVVETGVGTIVFSATLELI